MAYTCEMVNKSSKSNLCYIDSGSIRIVNILSTMVVPLMDDGQMNDMFMLSNL